MFATCIQAPLPSLKLDPPKGGCVVDVHGPGLHATKERGSDVAWGKGPRDQAVTERIGGRHRAGLYSSDKPRTWRNALARGQPIEFQRASVQSWVIGIPLSAAGSRIGGGAANSTARD